MRPVIRLSGVGVRYRRHRRALRVGGEEFWALKDITFDLERGQSLGIVGRNGAGKSTLLQVLADIVSPDRGTVERDDVRVGLLALNVGFLPELSGRDNAILSGRILGMSRAEMRALLPSIVEFAELEDFIDDPTGIYSHGMLARLGFSVALHVHTDVLLIDELLAVGDLEFQAKSHMAISKIIRSNHTVVLVSHSAEAIHALCSRVLWIENGVVQADGEPEDVLRQYGAAMELRSHE